MNTVIIGTGVAGVSFAEKYRSLDSAAEITLISRENDGYYSRPLLSRGFTKDDIEQSIILKTFDKLRANRINVLSNTEVIKINRSDQTIALREAEQEKLLPYDKLVLALGSDAFIPPAYQPYAELFFCLNSLKDLKAIRAFRQGLLKQQQIPHWAIIGGGLIGCEIASDLAVAGDKVSLLHATDRLMERQLADEDSVSLFKVLQASGVTTLLNQKVLSLSEQGEKITVTTDVTNAFDGVIVACGFKPRIGLAEQADLAVARGIKVDAFLQTNDPNIYALGDVAQLPNDKLYAFILPIRSQASWLAGFLAGQEQQSWTPPVFTTKAKVHGFEAAHAYNL
ncbi:MAG: FAD-dependent oxidoreductase [Methylococcales bacterium]